MDLDDSSDLDLEKTFVSRFQDSINVSFDDPNQLAILSDTIFPVTNDSHIPVSCGDSSDSDFIPPKSQRLESEAVSIPKPSQFARKRNGKGIFSDQLEEDTFFSTFDELISDALALKPVSSHDVLQLACDSANFLPLWKSLVARFGDSSALKKLTTKIRTFARNNRRRFPL